MKDVVIILAHCDTEEKVKLLRESIKESKRAGYDIIVSSHIKIPEDILHEIDFLVYGKDNAIIYYNECSDLNIGYGQWYNFPMYYQHYSIDYNHSYAVLQLMKNATGVAFSCGYEIIHFVNYDYIIRQEGFFENHSNIIKKDAELVFYGVDWPFDVSLFSIKTESFLNLIKDINSKRDYASHGKPVLEDFMLHLTRDLKRQVFNASDIDKNINDIDCVKISEIYGHILGTHFKLFLATDNSNYYISIVNEPFIHKEYEDSFYNIKISTGNQKYSIDQFSLYNSLKHKSHIFSIKIPKDHVEAGFTVSLPNHGYSRFFNLESNIAVCEIRDPSILFDIEDFKE